MTQFLQSSCLTNLVSWEPDDFEVYVVFGAKHSRTWTCTPFLELKLKDLEVYTIFRAENSSPWKCVLFLPTLQWPTWVGLGMCSLVTPRVLSNTTGAQECAHVWEFVFIISGTLCCNWVSGLCLGHNFWIDILRC